MTNNKSYDKIILYFKHVILCHKTGENMGYTKKNGLLYSDDLHTVLGVDDTSTAFSGRVPFGAHRIDDEVFSECPYESVSLPDSIDSLGNSLFENSKALEKVKLPSDLTELPPYLFSGCSALSKVTMPKAVTAFSEGLFMDCSSLKDIPFRAGITSLPESVFEGCSSIKSLVIPPTVKRIESKAVAGCSALESVVFPAGLEFIADDAFDGCTSLHNIRLDGESGLFFLGDEGSLYYADDEGDRVIVKAYGVNNQEVSFFKESVDDEPIAPADEDEFEDDDTFSAEIGASEEESKIMGAGEPEAEPVPEPETAESESETAPAANENVDSMLADIMGDEKERAASGEDVGVSENETEILSKTMSVMSDTIMGPTAYVPDSELETLFTKNEEEEFATHNKDNPDVLGNKAQILADSSEKSRIIECTPEGKIPEKGDLFVIAEKLAGDDFSEKLVTCCKTFARIHDYKKILMVYGLPLDNDEFVQFFQYFVSKENVILACDAESPSKLSDYCKKICELARISLNKEELAEQRRTASIKTNTLVKLVIRDKYEK